MNKGLDYLVCYMLVAPDGRFVTAINKNRQRYDLTWECPHLYKSYTRAKVARLKHESKWPNLVIKRVRLEYYYDGLYRTSTRSFKSRNGYGKNKQRTQGQVRVEEITQSLPLGAIQLK